MIEAVIPYEVVVPNSTCESEASFVVQLMVAAFVVTVDELTPEIVGAVVSIEGGGGGEDGGGGGGVGAVDPEAACL